MYAMPFPWFTPQTQNSDMTGKDWLEFIKLWDEFQKSNKPKEEKKDDKKKDPHTWDTVDYFTFILFFYSLFIVVGSVAAIHELTQFMKAIPH